MYTELIQNIRLIELQDYIVPFLDKDSEILEIGAGAGWQTKFLSDCGFNIVGIDIIESNYYNHRVANVIDYDGKKIPFKDSTFDVIFSSNVLEHISQIEDFLVEISRVLKPNGIVIHILPSTTWRFWTTITFPIHSLKIIFGLLFAYPLKSIIYKDNLINENNKDLKQQNSKLIKIYNIFIPKRHGERGNLISEHYLFSIIKWKQLFNRTGWEIVFINTNKLFYTGNSIIGSRINLNYRVSLSKFLGSTCNIFYLKKY